MYETKDDLGSYKAIQHQPKDPELHLYLAASLGQLGQSEEAGASFEACERLRPGYLDRPASWYPFKHAEDSEHFLDGLRKAGLPE